MTCEKNTHSTHVNIIYSQEFTSKNNIPNTNHNNTKNNTKPNRQTDSVDSRLLQQAKQEGF